MSEIIGQITTAGEIIGHITSSGEIVGQITGGIVQGASLELLSAKADKTYVDSQDLLKADKTYVDAKISEKANKQQEEWITPTLLNGWINHNPSYGDVKFYKDNFGIVRLQGMVSGGAIESSVFVLPIGYRPLSSKLYAVNSANTFGAVRVNSSGGVVIAVGSGYTALEGITFKGEK